MIPFPTLQRHDPSGGQMATGIGRRQFISALGGAVAWPHAAWAQSGRTARLGVLIGFPENDPEGERWLKSLREGLEKLGWKEGANLQIDLRWGDPNPDRLQMIAREFVELRPDVIQVTTTPATSAILRETKTIPVVFAAVSDPVGSGFVQNLPHPGGNVTGFINIEASIGGKLPEILKEIAPRTSRATVMFNPKERSESSGSAAAAGRGQTPARIPTVTLQLNTRSLAVPRACLRCSQRSDWAGG